MYLQQGILVEIKESKSSIKLKGLYKILEIYGFSIVEYPVRSENGCTIVLCSKAYYVPVLPKTVALFLLKAHSKHK